MSFFVCTLFIFFYFFKNPIIGEIGYVIFSVINIMFFFFFIDWIYLTYAFIICITRIYGLIAIKIFIKQSEEDW